MSRRLGRAEIGEGDAAGDIDGGLSGLVYTMTGDARRPFNPEIAVTNGIVVVYGFTKATLPIIQEILPNLLDGPAHCARRALDFDGCASFVDWQVRCARLVIVPIKLWEMRRQMFGRLKRVVV